MRNIHCKSNVLLNNLCFIKYLLGCRFVYILRRSFIILMDVSTFPENFDLEEFVEAFVSEALSLFDGYVERIDLDEFYNEIFAVVSRRSDIPVEMVRHLHNCFHWEFFCKKNNSPFEYHQPSTSEEKSYVGCTRKIKEEDKRYLSKRILNNYRDFLEARFREARKPTQAAS